MRLRLFVVVVLGLFTTRAFAADAFPYDAWNALLGKYVDSKGRVDYGAVDRAAFDKVVAAVAAPSSKKDKAFYLDAYNVLVWKYVLSRLPALKNVDSVKQSFFYDTKFVVGGEEMNLSDLENKNISPQFKDPRVREAMPLPLDPPVGPG